MPIATERIGPAPLSGAAEQYMVPMRDGVELATDVYLPAAGGPHPAVLIRLPYDKNSRYS
jgi:predicted acyl esterase